MTNTLRAKSRRVPALLATAVAMGLLVAGCSSPAQTGDGGDELPTASLRIAHGFTSTSTEQATLLEIADKVSERTKGKFKLQVFSDSALGSTAEAVEQAASGGDVIAFIDASGASVYGAPELAILSGPFLFDTTEQANAFIGTDLWNEWMTQLETKGNLKVLAFNWFDQPRDIMGTAGYSQPDDMKGVKIRIPPLDAWTKTFEAVGAVPTTLATAEVYSAIEQGVVNAGESAPNAMFAFQWQEVAKHLTRTGHIRPYLGYGMSAPVFNALPKEYQKVLTEEFEAGGERATAAHLANTEKSIAAMKKAGVTVHEADVAAYRALSAPFYDGFPDWRDGLVDLVRNAAK